MPVTIGPFTIKNKSVAQLIEDMLVCFGLEEDVSCQYDLIMIIEEKE